MIHTYRASWIRVVDSNTVILNVDLGFNTFRRESFKLAGVDEFDPHGENELLAAMAKEHLERILLHYPELRIETRKPDERGSWSAIIFCSDPLGGGETNVNEVVKHFLLNEKSSQD